MPINIELFYTLDDRRVELAMQRWQIKWGWPFDELHPVDDLELKMLEEITGNIMTTLYPHPPMTDDLAEALERAKEF